MRARFDPHAEIAIFIAGIDDPALAVRIETWAHDLVTRTREVTLDQLRAAAATAQAANKSS